MIGIILRRILIAIPVLIIVASITFFLTRLAPGGPFDAEKKLPQEVIDNLNDCLLYTSPSPRDDT